MDVNEEFLFKDRSSKFWWWLGVLYGDGCVTLRGRSFGTILSGHKKELDLTNKWTGLICPDATVAVLKRKGLLTNGTNAYIYSYTLGYYLMNEWGIIGKKTKNTPYPTGKIPKDMLSHFTRGLMDADGHIKITVPDVGNKQLKVVFSSSTPNFCSSLKTEIAACGVHGGALAEGEQTLEATGKTYDRWQLIWTGITALEICRWIYKDSAPDIQADKGPDIWKEAEELELIINAPCPTCGSTKRKMKGECAACVSKEEIATRPICPGILRHGKKCQKPIRTKGLCPGCYTRENYRAHVKSEAAGLPPGTNTANVFDAFRNDVSSYAMTQAGSRSWNPIKKVKVHVHIMSGIERAVAEKLWAASGASCDKIGENDDYRHWEEQVSGFFMGDAVANLDFSMRLEASKLTLTDLSNLVLGLELDKFI